MLWTQTPISPATTSKSALDYHLIPIDLNGADNGEPLVQVHEFGIKSRSAYALSSPPYHHSFHNAQQVPLLRETVARKLTDVNGRLAPYGVQVLVLDGFRSVALQQELWSYFIEVARALMPAATEVELVAYVGQYWSDPREYDSDDYRTWPTHNTGGAVDLTLQYLESGQDLFMGSIFDDSHPVSSTRYFENDKLCSLSSAEARKNRRLLYHAMHDCGFHNYHHEWWHYDFGTQMAIMSGAPEKIARYGLAIQ
ncbi:MAG TPA: M15 family metallopeptidase [Planktothrix sp.]|jgi:D-alanyl-D-alanine dipeptidase